MRSDGSRRVCSPTENADYFAATIGGLGLTGLILWAEIALRPVSSPFMLAESNGFTSVKEFLDLRARLMKQHHYHTAWVDLLAPGGTAIRGALVAGNNEQSSSSEQLVAEKVTPPTPIRVPFDMPNWLVNRHSAKWFNALYFSMKKGTRKTQRVHYRPFFYQLDSLADWNRLLGKRGFFQYHFVLPEKQRRGDFGDRRRGQAIGSGAILCDPALVRIRRVPWIDVFPSRRIGRHH